MKFRFSAKARADINSIWEYTFKNWSLEQADKYYNDLIARIKYLAAMPGIGREVSFGDKIYRCSQVESHVIYYRETSTNEIEVIRILHKRMDIEERLSE